MKSRNDRVRMTKVQGEKSSAWESCDLVTQSGDHAGRPCGHRFWPNIPCISSGIIFTTTDIVKSAVNLLWNKGKMNSFLTLSN